MIEQEYIFSQMKSIEMHMLNIQNQIYIGYDKPDHTGSLNQKQISLHRLLQTYTSLAITKYDLERELHTLQKEQQEPQN